jgi:hypothetical protein
VAISLGVSWSDASVVGYLPEVRTYVQDMIRNSYQETAREDIEDFMCAAVTVICRVCKPVWLLIGTCNYGLCTSGQKLSHQYKPRL